MSQPEIIVKKMRMSDHAIERALERFECKDKNEAIHYVKTRLGRAKYIGETTCDQGFRSHMYAIEGVAIYVSLDLDIIKSIVNLDSWGHYDELRPTIEKMYFKEFRKADRYEQTKINKLQFLRLKNEAEIAHLKFRIFKTRSKNVRSECETMIVKLQNEIKECEIEIKQIETKKRQIARAIATLVI